ncbi:SRSF2 [Symbiodinium sp. CCMP2456]|nr:SRSF2 [Symbiodinium sp. CCMP2456]
MDELHSLKVDGLYPDTRKDEVWDFFRKCGRIGDVYLPRDHSSQKNRGFAFVRFYDRRDAEMCVQDMDGQMFQGSKLRVNFAQVARGTEPPPKRQPARSARSRTNSRRRSRSRSRRRGRSRSESRGRSKRKDRSPSMSSSRSPSRKAKRGRR